MQSKDDLLSTPMREPLLTVDEVAELLQLSEYQIYELAKPRTRSGLMREHPLPSVKIGRSVRYRRSDIDAWLEKLVRAE